jgi:hypothetical protein
LSCSGQLSEKEVSMLLYGLQNLKNDCIEVRDILQCLPRLLSSCKEPLTEQAVNMSFYGIKNLKSECIEVKNILHCLKTLVLSTNIPLNIQALYLSNLRFKDLSNDNNMEMADMFKISELSYINHRNSLSINDKKMFKVNMNSSFGKTNINNEARKRWGKSINSSFPQKDYLLNKKLYSNKSKIIIGNLI